MTPPSMLIAQARRLRTRVKTEYAQTTANGAMIISSNVNFRPSDQFVAIPSTEPAKSIRAKVQLSVWIARFINSRYATTLGSATTLTGPVVFSQPNFQLRTLKPTEH